MPIQFIEISRTKIWPKSKRYGNMRKKIIRIRKSDHHRAILTDTLPYEVPLPFSNEGLYRFIKNNPRDVFEKEVGLPLSLLLPGKHTIPYVYKIRKNSTEYRSLSVMHPAMQLEVAEFYRKYSGMILAQCKKSAWTLRAPSSVASYYVEKTRVAKKTSGKIGSVDLSTSGFDPVPRTASSYFSYQNNLLYKFFESSDFHQLEKKFNLLLALDVSQCFGKIYTHTIAWAIKNKVHAKRNLKKEGSSFEVDFDRLMQCANYSETAGIIVGPEVSRVFAEIILQQIDLDIEHALAEMASPILVNEHYTIRRYVDDYFVFANNPEILNRIQMQISECLKFYKLSLNDAKCERTQRPFSTSLTAARINVANVLDGIFQKSTSIQEEEVDGKKVSLHFPTRQPSSERFSNRVIRDIKICMKAENLAFDAVSNYFLSTAKRLIAKYASRIKFRSDVHVDWIVNFLIAFLEVVFFFYCSSLRVRQTYLVAEILLILCEVGRDLPDMARKRVFAKISSEIKMIVGNSHSEVGDNIEIINLILILKSLGPDYSFDVNLLAKAFGLNRVGGSWILPREFGYFQIASLIYLIGDSAAHEEMRDVVLKHVLFLYRDDIEWNKRSELVMLLLDLVACDYLSLDFRHSFVKEVLRQHVAENRLGKAVEKFCKLVQAQSWFFDWSKEVQLTDVLERKQLRTPY
ncbi:MAG: antiviral reverse transcriptase Drt3b [Hydrogenophaga sp.]|uniref:antiviral reverse transcriptase Drt3b n=1 Tax=Hydrogenophaga sp. TaxID=1904254 RepID=UPI00403593B5